MDRDTLAGYFDRIRYNGRGFTALCPAHNDTTPSLTIAQGNSGWLVKCQSGCSFFDVARAAGLAPLAFKYDSLAGPEQTNCQANQMLEEMMQRKQRIPWKFDELCDLALNPDVESLATAMIKYPEFIGLSLPEAMKMHVVMYDGPLWEMVHNRYHEYGSNWIKAKQRIGALLWQEYRKQKSSLATPIRTIEWVEGGDRRWAESS